LFIGRLELISIHSSAGTRGYFIDFQRANIYMCSTCTSALQRYNYDIGMACHQAFKPCSVTISIHLPLYAAYRINSRDYYSSPYLVLPNLTVVSSPQFCCTHAVLHEYSNAIRPYYTLAGLRYCLSHFVVLETSRCSVRGIRGKAANAVQLRKSYSS
jgi:hypothetical protein